MLDWLWSVVEYVLAAIIGISVGIIGSFFSGLGCVVGFEGGCTKFPTFFNAILVFAPTLIGIAALGFFLTRPLKILAWLHYFFVPHPAQKAMRKGRSSGVPGKVDTAELARAMLQEHERDLDPRTMPSAYKSKNQRKRVEELRKKARADREFFEEVEARERARRRMERAKRGEE